MKERQRCDILLISYGGLSREREGHMKEFVLIPDTACDLCKEQRGQLGIPDYLHGIFMRMTERNG